MQRSGCTRSQWSQQGSRPPQIEARHVPSWFGGAERLGSPSEANGRPILTSEITLYVVRATGKDPQSIDMARAHDSVWYRLRDLMQEGLVERHPGATVHDPVAWSLVQQGRLRVP